MNRLHAEGERRSNDFGHRTIADKTKGLASAHLNIQPTRRTCQKKAGRAGRIGESRGFDLQSPPIEPAGRPVAPGWVSVGSIGFVFSIQRLPWSPMNRIIPEPSSSLCGPAGRCVELAMTHRPAVRCVFATHPTCLMSCFAGARRDDRSSGTCLPSSPSGAPRREPPSTGKGPCS